MCMAAVDTANTGTAAVQKFPGEPVAKTLLEIRKLKKPRQYAKVKPG